MTKQMRKTISETMKGCIEAAKKIRDELLDDNVAKDIKTENLAIYKYVLIANKNIVSAVGVDLMAERLYNTSIEENEKK